MLSLNLGDLFETQAESLVVPIDGTLPAPDEGRWARLLGNLGRQLMKRVPQAELVEELEGQLDLPLGLGKARAIEVERSPFSHVVLVSTLHHVGNLSGSEKRGLVRSSLASALSEAARVGCSSVATAILQGGWRLDGRVACEEMLKVVAFEAPHIALEVWLQDEDLHGHAQSLCRSMGIAVDGEAG